MRQKVRNTAFLIVAFFSSWVLAEGRGGRYPGRKPEMPLPPLPLCSPIFERLALSGTTGELRASRNVLMQITDKPANLFHQGVPVPNARVVRVLDPRRTGVKTGEEIVIIPGNDTKLSNLRVQDKVSFDLSPIPVWKIKHHGWWKPEMPPGEIGGSLGAESYSFDGGYNGTTEHPIFVATPGAKAKREK